MHKLSVRSSQRVRRIVLLALVLCVLLLFSASALALKTARMELPGQFDSEAERIQVKGFGGRNKGAWTGGEYYGDFTRGESRLGVFDPLYVSSRGKSSFSIQGPGFDDTVSANCEMKQGTVTIGVVTFDPKKMAYHCVFKRGDRPLAARFILGQPKPENTKARILAQATRRGEAAFDDHHITYWSSHKYQGSKLQSPSPVGYFLDIDGQLVGAVELTDVNPTLLLLPGLPDDVHRSVMLVAMALAVLRDPADSALGD